MERILYDQLYNYLTKFELLSDSQFGIRKFHSTASALLDCTNDCLLSSIATLAAPPIPASTPLAVHGLVLPFIGIPKADIGLIVAIDWFVDRFATPVSIWANCIACVIIEHYSREDLQSLNDVTTPREEICTTVGSDANSDVTIDVAEEEEVTTEIN
ncbi:excitatory amino acid transporter 1-like [Paramuricea clavata]|uniref:Amino acid transporter n=1 Tax=Paramuricea clavata TaxID=317549 RepID=A0A6S7HG68_PARCT|nr:excitatory amino acid transporter 1-like [Paramuricea clavata]